MRYASIPLLLLLGACAAMPPPQPSLTLPETATFRGAGDPTRGAILSSAHGFARPATVVGNPAAAAEAMGQLEFLAVELAVGGRWQGGFDALVPTMLAQGRAEARAAMRGHTMSTVAVGSSTVVVAEIDEVLLGRPGRPLVYLDRRFHSLPTDQND